MSNVEDWFPRDPFMYVIVGRALTKGPASIDEIAEMTLIAGEHPSIADIKQGIEDVQCRLRPDGRYELWECDRY